jgi:biopolymer transport protein ExbD
MPPKALAKVGFIALALALLVPWGYAHWLKTRTFKLVDKPVLLEAERIQTEDFEINLREFYHVQIEVDYSSDYWVEERTCPFRYWEAADWRVYRLSGRGHGTRELWASSAEMREHGTFPIGFNGIRGKYQLEWNVPTASVCLNTRHPRLHVYATSFEYEEFGGFLQFVCIFLGGTGILLVLRAIGAAIFGRFMDKRPPRIFPATELRNVIPWQRHRPMARIRDLPNFGLVYGFVLWVLVFLFMIFVPLKPKGLLVDFRGVKTVGVEKSPWTETLGVYVDAQRGFFVNQQPVAREELRGRLQEELLRRGIWVIYFEADSNCLFMDAVYAIDTIQGLGAKLVWITPKMREEWKQKGIPYAKSAHACK